MFQKAEAIRPFPAASKSEMQGGVGCSETLLSSSPLSWQFTRPQSHGIHRKDTFMWLIQSHFISLSLPSNPKHLKMLTENAIILKTHLELHKTYK